jgi:hypothetical protein
MWRMVGEVFICTLVITSAIFIIVLMTTVSEHEARLQSYEEGCL